MDVDEDQIHQQDLEVISQVAASEFSLEIGLRQRITETLNSRITWALLLKQSLQAYKSSPEIAPVSFRYAAFDALRASERPTEIFFEKEESAPPNVRLQESLRNARPAPRNKLQYPRSSKTTFLYIRSNNLAAGQATESLSEFSILKCPSCSRTTFTSLQGLLNHARLSHGLEWGTHEECVRACASPDPSLDLHDGLEVKVGASGILPGLRSIFEMAVGHARHEITGVGHISQHDEPEIDTSVSNHLRTTLGLHEDTSALARFLGKEPVRRGIKALQQDDCVDVCDTPTHPVQSRRSWRLRFAQRGGTHQTKETVESLENAVSQRTSGIDRKRLHSGEVDCSEDGDEDSTLLLSLPGSVTTRFHFATRIIITDRSLSIDPDQITSFTHKWMLTIDAPSYAHNITTILRKMTVTPLSSPESVKCSIREINQPPYVVVGLASQPFLARIDLIFNGVNDGTPSSDAGGQPFSLEHWVDLDPLRCSIAVTGEELICDVELDKRTLIRPANAEHPPTSYRPFWKLADEFPLDKRGAGLEPDAVPRLAYENVLIDLLPRFPLTLQDLRKKRGVKHVPYRLATTESQFFDMIEGRRKAIEWGRTRALRDVYNEHIKQSQSMELFPLSAADIHSWLREEGHIHLQSRGQVPMTAGSTENITNKDTGLRWCSLCGLKYSLHNLLPDKQIKEGLPQQGMRTETTGIECPIAAQNGSITKLRPIEIRSIATSPSPLVQTTLENSPRGFDQSLTKNIVDVADPCFTLEVRRLIHLLDLPAFRPPSNNCSPFPLDQLGQTAGEVKEEIAPYALLAMCMQSFIRKIVGSGLDVARREKVSGYTQIYAQNAKRKGTQDQELDISLLTPSHLLSGIRSRGMDTGLGRDCTGQPVLLCLSGLGTIFTPHKEETASGEPSHGGRNDHSLANKKRHCRYTSAEVGIPGTSGDVLMGEVTSEEVAAVATHI